jgi:hypothetical protein
MVKIKEKIEKEIDGTCFLTFYTNDLVLKCDTTDYSKCGGYECPLYSIYPSLFLRLDDSDDLEEIKKITKKLTEVLERYEKLLDYILTFDLLAWEIKNKRRCL